MSFNQYFQTVIGIIWATSWENPFMPYVNNKGADQPAYLRSLISAFVGRCLDSIVPLFSVLEISSLNLASFAAQAGLSLPGRKPRRQVQDRSKALLLLWFLTVTCSSCPYLYFDSTIMLVKYFVKF